MIGRQCASYLLFAGLFLLLGAFAPHASADDLGAFVTLVGDPDAARGKKCPTKEACPSMEVDEQGKQVVPEQDDKEKGKKHWYCGSQPNGSGGYQCTTFYLNRTGCNSHPTWSCQNVGSGATQNCVCQ